MNRRRYVLAVVLLLASATGAWGDAGITFSGSNDTNQFFNRPDSTSTLSGQIVEFAVQELFPAPVNVTANCTIRSVQRGNALDLTIALYRGPFNPASPLTNLIAFNDDLGNTSANVGRSAIENVSLSWVNDYYLVTSGYNSGDVGEFVNFIECADNADIILAANGSLPSYDGRFTELQHGRFRVSVTWRNFSGTTGHGYYVPQGSTESAQFWFFTPENTEVIVKVINACGFNNRFWVFGAALTNVEFTLTITDTLAPGGAQTKTYFNPLGISAPAVTDTSAFATCP